MNQRIKLEELHWRTQKTMPAYVANILTDAGVQLGVTDGTFSFAVAHGFYDQAAMMLIPENKWQRVEIGKYEGGDWFCQAGLGEDGKGKSRALAIADAAIVLALEDVEEARMAETSAAVDI